MNLKLFHWGFVEQNKCEHRFWIEKRLIRIHEFGLVFVTQCDMFHGQGSSHLQKNFKKERNEIKEICFILAFV